MVCVAFGCNTIKTHLRYTQDMHIPLLQNTPYLCVDQSRNLKWTITAYSMQHTQYGHHSKHYLLHHSHNIVLHITNKTMLHLLLFECDFIEKHDSWGHGEFSVSNTSCLWIFESEERVGTSQKGKHATERV